MYPYNHKLGQKIQTDAVELCDQAFIAHFSLVPGAAENDNILATTPLANSPQSIIDNIVNPDVPRCLQIKGNQAGVTGEVVITGTNYSDQEISETITLNGATAVNGTKAFKTVTQIDLPVEVNVGTDSVSIGTIDKLGLPYKLSQDTVMMSHFNNALIVPTVEVSETNIELNTIKFDTAVFDGYKKVDIYLLV